jgi:hypothetical protein
MKACKWTRKLRCDYELFGTECGETATLPWRVGKWLAEDFKFCPFCGKKIKVLERSP